MKYDKLYWPTDINSYYTNAVYNLRSSDISVHTYTDFLSNIYNLLERYLLVGKNNLILVKTSVTGKRKSNHEINNVILEKVIYVINKMCPNSTIILVDGPAYADSYYNECCRLNWNSIANKYNIEILDLNKDECFYLLNKWPVSKTWLNADKIINICKAKTHKRFGVTLSSKNLLGVFSGEVLGYPKFSFKHEFVPRLLYELYNVTPKMLNIIDGFHAIEGNGPMRGKVTESNFIIIGTDSWSCDFQATIEMGFAPATTIATLHPFIQQLKSNEVINNTDIIKLRNTNVDFYPHISCAWMYKSLELDFRTLQNQFEILMGGIRQCWEKGI